MTSGRDKKSTPISPVVASKCEDVLARSDACCEVLAGLAQELGNLLTVVSGWAQCLQEAKTSEREAVARCVHSGLERIRYSLNRLGSGRSTGRLAVTDANRLIASVLRGLDPRVRSGFALYVVELGNVMPCISAEGFEAETDKRRGNGHFKKLFQVFASHRLPTPT